MICGKILMSVALVAMASSSASAGDCTCSCPGQTCTASCFARSLNNNSNHEFTKYLPPSKYFVNAGEKTYYIETTVALNWMDAVAFCKNYGMKIANVLNSNEIAILSDHLQKNDILNTSYWIERNGTTQQCAQLYKNPSLQWEAVSCELDKNIICEF